MISTVVSLNSSSKKGPNIRLSAMIGQAILREAHLIRVARSGTFQSKAGAYMRGLYFDRPQSQSLLDKIEWTIMNM